MSTLLERSRLAGGSWAVQHPKKAAKQLVRIREHDLPNARARGDEHEAERLEAIAEGMADTLSEGGTFKLCRRCGAAIKDTSQPGWADDLGPECVKKVDRG